MTNIENAVVFIQIETGFSIFFYNLSLSNISIKCAKIKLHLSYNITSGSDTTPCFKIDITLVYNTHMYLVTLCK